MDGTVADGGTLWIEGEAVGLGSRIVVENFSQGDLGLYFPLAERAQLVPQYAALNPFVDPTYQTSTLTTEMTEGAGQAITLALNGPARAGQTVRLSIDQLATAFAIVSGAETLYFSNGYVELQLVEGQTQVVFSLLSSGNVEQDVSLELTAQIMSPAGAGATSTLIVDVDAREETTFTPPESTGTIYGTNGDDDLPSAQDPPGNTYYGLDGNDIIGRATSSPVAFADGGAGDDMIWGQNSNHWLLGGAGRDFVIGSWGNDHNEGGSGSDFVYGHHGDDQLFANGAISVEAAIAAGETDANEPMLGDVIAGYTGNDQLIGSSARDLLGGGLGRDVLVGGAGSDVLAGDRHFEFYFGWSPDMMDSWDFSINPVLRTDGTFGVLLYGGNLFEVIATDPGDADRLYAGGGDDLVLGGDGNDTGDGGSGNDNMFGERGDDTLFGQLGNDVIFGGGGSTGSDPTGRDFLDGGAGNDILRGGEAGDIIHGGADDDELFGDDNDENAGDDYLNGEQGNDKLYGDAGSDALYGGADNDELYGDFSDTAAQLQGNDLLDGGTGNDILIGAGGADTLIGGDGTDELHGDSSDTSTAIQGADFLDGGEGDDYLNGGGKADTLLGGAGNDVIHGDGTGIQAQAPGDDFLDGGAGGDSLYGHGGSDTLFGGDGDDHLFGDHSSVASEHLGDDYLNGGAGNDTLSGQGGDDVLLGESGNDSLYGDDGDDELIGGEGDDYIQGGVGNDVLVGGAGVDVLMGGAGDDTYLFTQADLAANGNIVDGVIDGAGSNRIVFSDLDLEAFTVLQGVQPGSINFVTADGMGVVVRGALSGAISIFEFADGREMTAHGLIGSYYAGNANQTSGADGVMLLGGTQADAISGLGNDVSLAGGRGNDQLSGGGGATTYLFNVGDGQDTITDRSTYIATGSVNRLALGSGFVLTDFEIVAVAGGSSATLQLGGNDCIVLNTFSLSDPAGGARTIDEIRFADQSSITWEQLLVQRGLLITNVNGVANVVGTSFNDVITGAAIAETINAGAGDDIIDGGGGSDQLAGGLGSDTYILRPGSGGDTINNFDTSTSSIDRLVIDTSIAASNVEFFRIGQSLLVRLHNSSDQVLISDYFGIGGLDEIVLGDGTVYTAANVPWLAQAESVFTYNAGDGDKTVQVSDPVGIVRAILRFGANVDPSKMEVSANSAGDLIIRFRNAAGYYSGDRITISGAAANAAARLDFIEFAGLPGLVLSAEDIQYRAALPYEDNGTDWLYGDWRDNTITAGTDSAIIKGQGGNDVLRGGSDSDSIDGGDGDDTLSGGGGTDSLIGGAGNDTFLVQRSDRTVTLYASDPNLQAQDVMQFGAGLDHELIRFSRSNNDLVISFDDPDQATPRVTVVGFFNGSNAWQVLDAIRFSDAPGVVLTPADALPLFVPIVATEGADELNGTSSADTLIGLGGNDRFFGWDGDDHLYGGTGRDSLYGHEGNDTYYFNRGDGFDLIGDNANENNRIVLGAGILASEVMLIKTFPDELTSNGPALIVRIDDHDQLTVNYYFGSSGPRISSIVFADGTVWTTADIAARVIDRTADVNTHTGTSGDDTFYIDNSADGIVEAANSGVDTVYSTVSYSLAHRANVENLYLQGTVDLSAVGNTLNNIIGGNSGNNVLDGYRGQDTLIGGAGDDRYHVNATVETNPVDDQIIENANEGYDTMISDIAYGGTLAANVERLIYLPGTTYYVNTPPRMRGNELDNELIVDMSGVANGFELPAIIIDGGAGADRMVGSRIGETYVVDNVGDQVVELGGLDSTRVDTVRAYISYEIGYLIENLDLYGTAAITGTGNEYANAIDGSINTSANVLIGRGGNDRYILGAGDSIVELAGEGSDTVVLNSSTLSGSLASYANVENIEIGASGPNTVTGDAGDNVVTGNGANNLLQGGAGNDTIYDSSNGAIDYDTLQGGDGNDHLISRSYSDLMDGGAGDDVLIANYGSNNGAVFQFGRGSDYDIATSARTGSVVSFNASVATGDVRMTRDGSNLYVYIGTTDRLTLTNAFVDATSWSFAGTFSSFQFHGGTIWGAAEVQALIQAGGSPLPSTASDVLSGTGNSDRIDGLAGDDTLSGLGGDDRLEGSLGNDVMIGGAGADTYYFSSGFGLDVIRDTEAGQVQDSAIDRVIFDSAIARDEIVFLRSEVDANDLWVRRRGTGERITVENFFADPTEADHIEQFVFADGTIVTSDFLRGVPTIEGTQGADNLQASVGSTLNGYGGNDTLTGSSFADTLDGGVGADTMTGGGGNDLYRVDDAGDVAAEAAGGGVDTIVSRVSCELGAHIENLQLEGDDAIDGTGNDLDNTLTGNEAANVLDGRGGADVMAGNGGSDIYVVDNAADVVMERASEGHDTVQAYLTYALSESIESLVLLGSANADATGNSSGNYLRGNDGNNRIDGGAGADTLVGGLGNDRYIIDNVGDIVVEGAGAGTDTIATTVSYRAADNVENVELLGSAALNATGNALGNSLIGNSADNVLDGEGGADFMQGGVGNDTYVVDLAGDVVVELADAGIDQIVSSVDYQLGDHLERLRLTGAGASAIGNALNNTLEGNSQANFIDGGLGNDAMSGATGDDTYIVDAAGDTVTEVVDGGTDTVRSAVTFTLGANIEHLALTGTAASNGTGNGLANNLIGNASSNALNGGGGNDLLDGGGGVDSLNGGAGDDLYVTDGGDTLSESFDQGIDLVRSSVTYALLDNFEDLELLGTDNISGTGNGSANRITGNSGNNTLNGLGGADTLTGGAGDDIYVVDVTGDVVVELAGEGIDTVQAGASFTLSEQVENLTLTGSGAFIGTGNGLSNVILGNSGANQLFGGAGNDTLTGGAGNDTMTGGEGDDTYSVTETGDVIAEAADGGTDSVTSSVAYTLSAEVENLTLTGTGNINATGNASANVLTGNAGNNVIDGGAGADTMTGGLGNDTYIVDNVADTIVEAAAAGTESVQASVSYTLSANVENITLTGNAVSASGNTLDNIITGNAIANVLTGGAGNDTYIVQNSDDSIFEAAGEGVELVQSSASYALSGNVENLTLTGTAAIDGTGNDLNNVLTGNTGANVLDGGLGADSMSGGTGDDTYVVDNAGDTVTELSNAGTDLVRASISYALGANVERLTLTGTAAIDGTGNLLANVINGNSAANLIDGGAGTDQMTGGAGDDIYVVDATADVVTELAGEGIDLVRSSATFTLGAEIENLTLIGTGFVNGTGNALSNILIGNINSNTLFGLGGNDLLDGGAGNDRMEGGLGDDVYYVSETGDTIVEADGAGFDVVFASATTSLSNFVENLTLTGTSAINGTGNALANVITGNSAANQLTGGAGVDTLIGGGGDDVYIIDVAADIIVENANEGIDTIQSGVTLTLIDNVENLTLTGSTAIDGTGNAVDNVIIGNANVNNLVGGAGNDTLNGGGGADRMTGGTGDDLYSVDVAGDVIVEDAGGGIDTVQSTISFILGAELENLTLTSTGSINATGNAVANVLIGNTGANTLNGLAGADTLSGGAGNDIYVVDDVGDVVIEIVDVGVDTVQSSISFVLGANVENLTLTGTANINGTGNELANVLTGNTGANVLTGGAGNDTYVIDNGGDAAVEYANEGVDSVQSTLTYTLGVTLENLTLTGSALVNGTGNEYDNVLTGNNVANTLTGGAGNDTLNGAGGNDTMIGGTGDDIYVVDSALDVITELAGEGIDLVQSNASAYTLANEVENLTLINGTTAIGNGANNILTGNTGANTLNGGAGADTMIGGSGNDTYVVDEAGDVVTELAAGGTDIVQSSINYMLGANVENLTLTGTANLGGTGNELANVLTGNSGSNVLTGLAGDDTYILDSSVDTLVEAANEGIDTVQIASTYTLLDNFENLTLTGSASVNGFGNALDNVLTGTTGANTLTGGAGNDTLNGGAGADAMIGGTSNDNYSVDNTGDVVTELAGEGIDTVTSTLTTYTLGSDVENLTLGGGSVISGIGNELDNALIGNSNVNTLTGNAGNDTLDGGGSNDTMIGGTGDDTYIVAQTGDVTTENSSEGTDTVQSSVTYTLSAHIERLLLTSTGSINGTGNELANYIAGNAQANTLTGLLGDDTLTGGNGADIYSYSAGHGSDTIENVSTDTAQDRLLITNLTRAEFAFSRDGDDLLVSRNGSTTDRILVADWFVAQTHQLDFVQFSDQTLTAAQINTLIPPALMGDGILGESSEQDLTQDIAALFAVMPADSATTAMDRLLLVAGEDLVRESAATQPAGVAANDGAPLDRWLAIRNHLWRQPDGGFAPVGGEEMPLPAALLLGAGETARSRLAALKNMEGGMRSRDEAIA